MSAPVAAEPRRPEAAAADTDDVLLRVRGLTIDFRLPTGALRAVEDVGFSLHRGACLALVGESGSGKSTIAQCVQGILPHTAAIAAGTVHLGRGRHGEPAVEVTALRRDSRAMLDLRGGRVATIFQEPMTALSPLHTIGDQVSEPLRLHRAMSRRQAAAAVVDILAQARFPDPERAVTQYPFELSGGLRQRAMIAMALAGEPDVLIADEPTTALDVTTQAEILALLETLRRELSMSVLLITHDLGVVAQMAAHMVVLHRGRIVEAGPVAPLYRTPAHPYLTALMGAVPRLRGPAQTRLTPLREITVDTARLYAARGRTPAAPAAPTAPTAPTKPAPAAGTEPETADRVMLRLRDVEKSFPLRHGGLFRLSGGSVHAVRGVNLEVRAGTSLGLVGESGCGKTTLMRLVTGVVRPSAGQVLFDAGDGPAEVARMGRARLTRYRREVQYVFQDPFSSLNPRMTVREILSEPLLVHGIGTGRERVETTAELLRLVGLDPRMMSRYPHSFSGGQRQRLCIARALALNPRLLLCDEPVSALDVSVQAQVLNLLSDLRAALGLTMVFVSHNLAVVRHIADTIVVMCAGRLVEAAPSDRLVSEARHPYTQALLAAVPEPDPAQKVRPEALGASRASDPAAWPAPYTPAANGTTHWRDLGGGHLVAVGDDP